MGSEMCIRDRINTETPKGLLEIKGERLIECTIRQLHEVGITEIYVVVGFMKEQYEYLIDEYGVICESAVSIFRAGADILITYFACELADAIRKGDIG